MPACALSIDIGHSKNGKAPNFNLGLFVIFPCPVMMLSSGDGEGRFFYIRGSNFDGSSCVAGREGEGGISSGNSQETKGVSIILD
jgi:hypothetical protein